MAEQSHSHARMEFSPDQLSFNGYVSISGDFIRCLESEGATNYLAALHEQRHSDPIHHQISRVRQVMEGAYQKDASMSRLGEAFEDGALVGSLIAEMHYKSLMPLLSDDITRTLGDYEENYGVFSERQIDFANAVRTDSGMQFARFTKMLLPIVDYIDAEKYGSPSQKAGLTEGACFILWRLLATHSRDYDQFRFETEAVDILYPTEHARRDYFAQEVLGIIEREQQRFR